MKSFLLIVACLTGLSSGHHMMWHHYGMGSEPMAIDAVEAVTKKLKALHEEGEQETSCVSDNVKAFFCMGADFSAAVQNAKASCGMDSEGTMMRMDGDAKECFLQALGWLDSNGDIDGDAVRMSLETTELGPELVAAEAMCQTAADNVNADTVQDILDDDDSAMDMFSMDRQMYRRGGYGGRYRPGRHHYGSYKPGSWWGKPEPSEPVLTNVEEATEIVRAFAYFGCLHHSIDEACQERANHILEWQAGWLSTGVIPTRVSAVPPPLFITDNDGDMISPGDVVVTDKLLEKPTLEWECDPDKLYTVMLMDNAGIPEGNEYFNWLVHDIPGCDIEQGVETFSYLPPFSFFPTRDADGNLIVDRESEETLPFMVLVFEQPGPITIEPTQTGCDEGLTSGVRSSTNPMKMQVEYGLIGPVAGNVFLNPYSGQSTDDLICAFTNCINRPFPIPLLGSNDNCDPALTV